MSLVVVSRLRDRQSGNGRSGQEYSEKTYLRLVGSGCLFTISVIVVSNGSSYLVGLEGYPLKFQPFGMSTKVLRGS